MRNRIVTAALGMLLMLACNREVKPIAYGEEDCHWCQMRIMDPKFGAQAVTDKGRAYKFDSAECLLHYLNGAEQSHAHLVVTDFAGKHALIDARSAWFLVSEQMPSPMGGNLNAFSTQEIAERFQNEAGGLVYDWAGIQAVYSTR